MTLRKAEITLYFHNHALENAKYADVRVAVAKSNNANESRLQSLESHAKAWRSLATKRMNEFIVACKEGGINPDTVKPATPDAHRLHTSSDRRAAE